VRNALIFYLSNDNQKAIQGFLVLDLQAAPARDPATHTSPTKPG